MDDEPGLVGELLQLDLPQPHPRSVRAATIGRDRQLSRMGIALPSHAFAPAADRLYSELGRVARDPDADEAGVGGHIVDAIGHDLASFLSSKSCTFTRRGSPFGRQSVPPFLKLPISSFFLVSTEITGCCWACAATTFALICSNCAFRSGCLAPSFALRLDWRENPSFTSSLRTVSALIGCPISVRAAASFSMLFDTQIKGRIGSPNVAGSTSRSSARTSPGSSSERARRPPPARRTRPLGSPAASRSSFPRLIVERASPVTSETAARPPHPALRTSPAANNRRPRSSSFEPTASHRCRIAFSSIIPPTYVDSLSAGIPETRAAPSHDQRSTIQLLFEVSLVRSSSSPRPRPHDAKRCRTRLGNRHRRTDGTHGADSPGNGGRDGAWLHQRPADGWDRGRQGEGHLVRPAPERGR